MSRKDSSEEEHSMESQDTAWEKENDDRSIAPLLRSTATDARQSQSSVTPQYGRAGPASSNTRSETVRALKPDVTASSGEKSAFPSSAPASASAVNAVMGPPPPKEDKKASWWKRMKQDKRDGRELNMPTWESERSWRVRNFAG